MKKEKYTFIEGRNVIVNFNFKIKGHYFAAISVWHKGNRIWCLIDAEDIDLIKNYRWCLNNFGYVVTGVSNGGGSLLFIHRLIMSTSFNKKQTIETERNNIIIKGILESVLSLKII